MVAEVESVVVAIVVAIVVDEEEVVSTPFHTDETVSVVSRAASLFSVSLSLDCKFPIRSSNCSFRERRVSIDVIIRSNMF